MKQPAKHTPGPWQISAIQNEPEKISIIDADMCFVAEVWQTYISGESRQQAHATLIAAAPAMYEALLQTRKVIEAIDDYQVFEDLQNVLIAINKTLAEAEGKQ